MFPQFATHNAQTLAAVHGAGRRRLHAGQYEFQCLHGMGEPLYEQVVGPVAAGKLGRPCRIYAPVGPHDTLLAYLVRRLLENGANSSFVNRIADENVPLEELVQDPVRTVQAHGRARRRGRPAAPGDPVAAAAVSAQQRANSRGLDLADEATLAALARALAPTMAERPGTAAPLLAP